MAPLVVALHSGLLSCWMVTHLISGQLLAFLAVFFFAFLTWLMNLYFKIREDRRRERMGRIADEQAE